MADSMMIQICKLAQRAVEQGSSHDLVCYLHTDLKPRFDEEANLIATIVDPAYRGGLTHGTINGNGFSVQIEFSAYAPKDSICICERIDFDIWNMN